MMKKINIVDIIIVLGVIIALAVGIFTSKHYRQTADNQVFLRGVTVTGEEFPIKANDKTFITIRNVPYTELNVVKVDSDSRKIVLPSLKTKEQYILIKDPAQPSIYDAVVTISDTAKITKDGAVVGGNKIKIGLPVTLEGKNYKFNGTISDVRVSSDADIEDTGADNLVG